MEYLGPEISSKVGGLLDEMLKAGKQQLVREVSLKFHTNVKVFMIYVRTLTISVSNGGVQTGTLIVFDDITELVKNSKIKTWQEAAQQMAHEIKNPLTPIQLATERLQRKFGIALEQEHIFLDCTNTILQQVKIIKDLVTHFSQFASMPLPSIEQTNINELITEVLCLYRVGYPDIIFLYDGLKGGEQIIISNIAKVRPNTKVQIVDKEK